MKKSFFVIIACIACVLMFQAFTTSNEPRFKNLKVLPQDITKDDLDTVMHHFTASLGVKCNYCHVRNEAIKKMDFASDDKPEKLIARRMMLMAIDINTKYFKDIEEEMSKEADHDMAEQSIHLNNDSVKNMLSYVTCYTCHRGDAHPETRPPKREEGPRPAAAPVPSAPSATPAPGK